MSQTGDSPSRTATLAERLADAITIYSDLGLDAEGHSHHYDNSDGVVVVCIGDERAGRPRDRGVERVERLGGRSLTDWIRFVDEKRGWSELSAEYQHVLGGED